MENQGELFMIQLDSSDMDNPMLKAARAQLRMLDDAGLLKPEHALQAQMVLSLADVMGKSQAKGQASAMSFASKELREAMALLPKQETISSMDELMKALQNGAPDAADPLYK
ncbi:hypothetical protein PBI_ATRAXA_1 [Arthrobacter phage Atraxa]|uniref:Terminase small subunit n=1 Tax=Arthrobacter phage Atraxa TaxID=2419947 RepID=A0A3G2KDA0_9CAUD|nr:hypothetical protein PP342_gp01 [Arthrobacter phage Atraxa]AYN56957.1 hypothetical protein PBI_ATRAXA_1 [Arthrobacter phage Atraxa]AYN59065.1 hypothetical protein PBI_SPUTNIK_1 [Arthrobacter phage Sputnik]